MLQSELGGNKLLNRQKAFHILTKILNIFILTTEYNS